MDKDEDNSIVCSDFSGSDIVFQIIWQDITHICSAVI